MGSYSKRPDSGPEDASWTSALSYQDASYFILGRQGGVGDTPWWNSAARFTELTVPAGVTSFLVANLTIVLPFTGVAGQDYTIRYQDTGGGPPPALSNAIMTASWSGVSVAWNTVSPAGTYEIDLRTLLADWVVNRRSTAIVIGFIKGSFITKGLGYYHSYNSAAVDAPLLDLSWTDPVSGNPWYVRRMMEAG